MSILNRLLKGIVGPGLFGTVDDPRLTELRQGDKETTRKACCEYLYDDVVMCIQQCV